MNRNKTQKIRTVFTKYAVSFCAMTVALIIAFIGLLFAGTATGFILPANYAETQIAEAKPELSAADEITPDIIPELCEYAVFTPEGTYLSGSLDSAMAVHVWNVITDKTMDISYQYTAIERENEVCVLRYALKSTFNSATLRKVFPNVDIVIIVLFISCFIAGVLILSFRFGKLLAVKMRGLQEVTEKIQQQDLDFSIKSSGIYEFDNVLLSLNKMKDALKDSLQQQWNLEQNRKEQIAALAHDIKTPVTIIRGNAELLKETPQNEIQKEYTRYIFSNANQVEKYIRQLIDISKMQDSFYIEFDWTDTAVFLQSIENQMKALAATKSIKSQMERRSLPERLHIDKELLFRAIINVLDNAVEYTPNGGKILFTAEADGEMIKFYISDSGSGFSEADIKEAANQFYMSDRSRAAGNHYGMGLYITDSIVKQHGGALNIANSSAIGGGEVSIYLPYKMREGLPPYKQ